MGTYNLSLSIDANNPIVAEWRHMLAHILGDGVAVTNFYMSQDGLNLVIETSGPITDDVKDHLKLTDA